MPTYYTTHTWTSRTSRLALLHGAQFADVPKHAIDAFVERLHRKDGHVVQLFGEPDKRINILPSDYVVRSAEEHFGLPCVVCFRKARFKSGADWWKYKESRPPIGYEFPAALTPFRENNKTFICDKCRWLAPLDEPDHLLNAIHRKSHFCKKWREWLDGLPKIQFRIDPRKPIEADIELYGANHGNIRDEDIIYAP